jgi:hypothetical protein
MSQTILKMGLVALVVIGAGLFLDSWWREGGKLAQGDPPRAQATMLEDDRLMEIPVGDSDIPGFHMPKAQSLSVEDVLPSDQLAKLGESWQLSSQNLQLPGWTYEESTGRQEMIPEFALSVPSETRAIVITWQGYGDMTIVESGKTLVTLVSSTTPRWEIINRRGPKLTVVARSKRSMKDSTRIRVTYFR